MMLDAVYREGKKMAYQEAKHSALIAETAVELFKKNGYESVSVNEICKAAGLSRSSFYATFPASGTSSTMSSIRARWTRGRCWTD